MKIRVFRFTASTHDSSGVDTSKMMEDTINTHMGVVR